MRPTAVRFEEIPPWSAWWNEGPDGPMSVKGARLWRASRSDGEAALDPQRPARQRLTKRFRASPDPLRSRLLRLQTNTWSAASVGVDEDDPAFF